MGFTKEDFRNFMRFYADLVQLSEEDYEKLDQVSISDYVSRYVKSDLAKGLVGYFSSIDFVTRDDETPIGEYARCLNEIARNKAVGYPVGGTGKIPEAYCRIIRERDGRVLTGTAVKKILVEDRKATGVVLANGERQKADLVISNAGIRDTVRFLVGEDKYPQAHTDRIRRYRYSYSTSTIKIALNEKLSSDSMIFYIGRRDLSAFENQMELTGELPDMAPSLMIPVVSNLDPESAPEGKQLMIAGGSCRMPHNAGAVVWKKWEKAIMNSLEVIFPDILEHILWTVATSPEDIDRFAGEDGSVIGIGQMLGQVGDNRPKILDEYVQNLYHCSADTGLHGIGGELAMDAAFRLYKHLG
jgi:phytoene dehydrogenase-like protein